MITRDGLPETTTTTSSEKVTWILGALVIATIPLRPQLGFIALLLLGLVGIYRTIASGERPYAPRELYLLVAMFAVRLCWIALADDTARGWKNLESEGAIAAFPAVFLFLRITPTVRRRAVGVYIAMCTAVILFSFFLLFQSFRESQSSFSEYFSTYFSNPQASAETTMLNWRLAHYSFMSVMMLYGIHMGWYEARRPRERLALFIYILLTAAFVVFSGSVSGAALFILGFVAFLTFYLFKRWSISVIRYALLVALLSVSSVAYWLYYTCTYDKIDAQRNKMATIAVEAIRERPLLGYGTGSGAQVMHNEEFEYHYSFAVNHPHNQYLNELIQFGIIGSIPFFLFVVASLLFSVKRRDGALFAVLTIGFTFMLVESPLSSNKGELPFLFAVCLLACTRLPPKPDVA